MLEAIDTGSLALSEGAKNWIRIQKERSQPLESVLEKDDNLNWLQSLPTLIEETDFILVHAGMHPDYGVDTPPEIATMIRVYG
jgi:hypothetical protein